MQNKWSAKKQQTCHCMGQNNTVYSFIFIYINVPLVILSNFHNDKTCLISSDHAVWTQLKLQRHFFYLKLNNKSQKFYTINVPTGLTDWDRVTGRVTVLWSLALGGGRLGDSVGQGDTPVHLPISSVQHFRAWSIALEVVHGQSFGHFDQIEYVWSKLAFSDPHQGVHLSTGNESRSVASPHSEGIDRSTPKFHPWWSAVCSMQSTL